MGWGPDDEYDFSQEEVRSPGPRVTLAPHTVGPSRQDVRRALAAAVAFNLFVRLWRRLG